MFRAFSRPSSLAQRLQWKPWFYVRIVVRVVLCSWSGRPAGRPDHEHTHPATDDSAAAAAEHTLSSHMILHSYLNLSAMGISHQISVSNCNLFCVKKNQLAAQLILSIFRQPLHVSGVSRPIIRRYNCMYTTTGTYYYFLDG